ncbi:MAG: aspartyl/asparaginyl beta-hydroxylase domain-containing protein [Lysobacterales bacterium]
MSSVTALKLSLLGLFVASVLFVHWRGRVRLPLVRQLFNHSALLAPLNVLLYLFSAVPARPYLDRRQFPELDRFREHWQTIREEALALRDQGRIQAATGATDASFNSFFKEGWTRFYLCWYGAPLPSAEQLCPRTLALVQSLPGIRAAMFTRLPAGAKLNPHRDPFAGSLRYHLGLVTPNDPRCVIHVDGEPYVWHDGEDVLFDETFVHWAENASDQDRIIFFCDLERPLRPRWLGRCNHAIGSLLGAATRSSNLPGERLGAVNRIYAGVDWLKRQSRRLKHWNRPLYKTLKVTLILALLYGLFVAGW